MYAYHFNIGNSTDGGIGCSANIVALNRKAAVARLRMLLPDMVHIHAVAPLHPTEYINVYFNAQAIVIGDIDDAREVSETPTPDQAPEVSEDTTGRGDLLRAELEQLRTARLTTDTLLINAAPGQTLTGVGVVLWHVNRAKVLGNDPVTAVLGLMEAYPHSSIYNASVEWLASRARGEAEL